jgi:transmembrane sensor
MKSKKQECEDAKQAQLAAASWTVRIGRGLSAVEQDAFSDWLAADPKNAELFREHQWAWDELDRLAGLQPCSMGRIDPDLLNPFRDRFMDRYRRKWWMYMAISLPVILLFVAGVMLVRPTPPMAPEVQPALELMTRIEQRVLDDGTKVELNRAAVIEVDFSSGERRIRLRQGEANFAVAKDPDRPFVVSANGVDVRAVGTEFSVKLIDSVVDVVVTEGKVLVPVLTNSLSGDPGRGETIITVGQLGRIEVENQGAALQVKDLSDAELEVLTLWRPRLLDYDDTPLREIVAEFNRSNPIKVILGEPDLGELHLSSSFWSDNVEGFVRLLASSFGMEADWQSSHEIVLRKQREKSVL